MDANTSAIAGKAAQSAVDANASAIGANATAMEGKADQSAVDANTSAIAGKADQSALDALAVAVAGNTTDIAQNISELAEVEGRVDSLAQCHSYPTPRTCSCGAEWEENGNGTATQCLTGLMWEMKTDDGSIHDKDNTYTWSGPSYGTTYEFDGTAKTAFIDALNAAPCFAGYCDWRLPTHSGSPEYPTGEAPELESLLIEPLVCGTSPCTNIPGETVTEAYWSSVTGPTGPTDAWIINFGSGGYSIGGKIWSTYVRAVRDPS